MTADQCPPLSDIPTDLEANQLQHLLCLLDQLRVCPGHPDDHYVDMVRAKEGKLISTSGDIAAYIDSNAHVQLVLFLVHYSTPKNGYHSCKQNAAITASLHEDVYTSNPIVTSFLFLTVRCCFH